MEAATTWLRPVRTAGATDGVRAVDGRRRLLRILAAGDAAAVLVGFAAVLIAAAGLGRVGAEATIAPFAAVAAGLWAVRAQGLWNSRTISVRWTELVGLTRAAAVLGAGVLLLDRVVGLSLPLAVVVAGSVLAWILLVAWRSVYRSWLTLNRRQGRFTQHTVVVGTDRRALELIRLAEVHPETGTRVVGLVGSRRGGRDCRPRRPLARRARRHRRRAGGRAGRPHRRLRHELDPAVLATLIGREHEGGPEVAVHAGLSGIGARRVTVSAVANEALLHVEPAAPSAWHGRQAAPRHRRRRGPAADRRPGVRDRRGARQARGRRASLLPPAAGRA